MNLKHHPGQMVTLTTPHGLNRHPLKMITLFLLYPQLQAGVELEIQSYETVHSNPGSFCNA